MSNDDLLKEIRDRYSAAEAGWTKIREEGRKDIKYVSGDPWDEKDRQAREAAGRPVISHDEIGQYVNQLINEVRLNKRAIKVTSLSTELGDQMDRAAEARANLIRQIEYRSNAPQQAYTTMFENAAQRSFGWLRIVSKFVSERSFDKELSIVEIPNPDLVTPDPDHQMADGSDLRYLFFHEWYTEDEFKRKWPKAEHQNVSKMAADIAPRWCKGDKVMVAEYWAKTTTTRTLLAIQTPQGPQFVYKDELTAGANPVILRSREVDTTEVCSYLTNGVEILTDKQPWPGKHIPFVPCYGKVLFVEDGGVTDRRLMSLVRLARDPVMLHAYLWSCIAEIVGAVPRNSWLGYEGQFAGHEQDWQKANHVPVAFLEARATTEATGATILPLPVRQPWDPPLQNMLLVSEAARRAIQAAMGTSPLPTSAQRRNEKSGKALQQIEEAGQKGSFHFIDHYEASIRRTGEILNDLIPHYYDTPRDVAVRKPDDTTQQLRINDPNAVDPDTNQPAPVMFTEGSFDVTIGTGPSFDSEREAASDFADLLMQTPFAQMVADLAVKLKNLGPIGDQLAERLTPAPFRKPKDGKVDVTAMQQQIAEAQQAIGALTTELEQRVKQIETEEVKAKKDILITEMKNAAAIRIAEINASIKGYTVEAAHAADHEEQALGREFEAAEAESQRLHEAGMSEMGHGQALEQGTVGHQQALEQSAQQAALQPPPPVE